MPPYMLQVFSAYGVTPLNVTAERMIEEEMELERLRIRYMAAEEESNRELISKYFVMINQLSGYMWHLREIQELVEDEAVAFISQGCSPMALAFIGTTGNGEAYALVLAGTRNDISKSCIRPLLYWSKVTKLK